MPKLPVSYTHLPHSITCVVEGGDDHKIAETILYHKGLGCYTNGKTEIEVIDQNEYVNKIRFYRPDYIPIFVKVTLRKYTGYISSLESNVKLAIYDYLKSLEIGRDISISMLTGVVTVSYTHLYIYCLWAKRI